MDCMEEGLKRGGVEDDSEVSGFGDRLNNVITNED